MSQVSIEWSKRVPRTWWLQSYVFEVGSSVMCCDAHVFDPLSGVPCFPFYRPRESTSYSGGKEENERKKSVRIAGSFFSFMRVPLTL